MDTQDLIAILSLETKTDLSSTEYWSQWIFEIVVGETTLLRQWDLKQEMKILSSRLLNRSLAPQNRINPSYLFISHQSVELMVLAWCKNLRDHMYSNTHI